MLCWFTEFSAVELFNNSATFTRTIQPQMYNHHKVSVSFYVDTYWHVLIYIFLSVYTSVYHMIMGI